MSRFVRALPTALALAVSGIVTAAHASDVPIDGRKLVIKRSSSGREKLTFVSSDPDQPFPLAGSQDDPATGAPGGLTIEIFSAADATHPALAAPAGAGSPGWRSRPDAYVFTNPSAPGGISPVRKVSLKRARTLKVVSR